ncbi:MAG TPA: DUF4145 domain-containing protein [Candidatus Acidoferrum sp.]|nr:DUF4145 domain-containing protein [Candidatus Acidoferrum sp.]
MAGQIKENATGFCPHCGKGVQFIQAGGGAPSGWFRDSKAESYAMEVVTVTCPACQRPIVALQFHRDVTVPGGTNRLSYSQTRLVWPSGITRKPLPKGTPAHIADDYQQAALVLPHSEKASAALSRRGLQSLLREAGKTKSKDLADQIDETLPTLPSYLQTQLDAVRNIGNFAVHQQKSKATGEIIDVEPGEAEWNLDVLDLLFDFYYEQPRIAQEKRDALNRKLAEAGKPPMK